MARIFLALLFLPSLVFAYSNPGNPTGLVNDFAGVLTADQLLQIESQLAGFKKDTGVEIAVATIKSLEGDTVENYAAELFQEWGIGEKGKDNGVLFLVAVEDHEMRIEVGYGLEGLLTDAQTYWIQQNVAVPAFRNNDFYSGISGVAQKIISAVNQEEIIPSESPATTSSPIDGQFFFWLILIVPLWLARILGRSKSWWLGGVLGGAGGLVLGLIYGFLYTGFISTALLIPVGLLFDFFVSRGYQKGKATGHFPWWIGGGGRGGFGGGGGFGGFGGGGSGGGGSSSRW